MAKKKRITRQQYRKLMELLAESRRLDRRMSSVFEQARKITGCPEEGYLFDLFFNDRKATVSKTLALEGITVTK